MSNILQLIEANKQSMLTTGCAETARDTAIAAIPPPPSKLGNQLIKPAFNDGINRH